MNDKEMFKLLTDHCYSAVISDSLDDLGFRDQVMRENIKGLDLDLVCVGRAKTILAVDIYHIPDDPYTKEIQSVDSILPGEIVIACTNGSTQNGMWGELLSTAAYVRGGVGAIIDGFIRDAQKIKELGFPVYTTGTKPVDSKGRGLVIDYDIPVKCGDVLVHPGDIVFADRDGIVVIPQQIAQEVVELAMDKASRENATRNELLEGKYLADVYAKYGVL